MTTGYYFENDEEEEILYVPYGFTLVRNGQDYDENYFCLDCNPNHLEEIVLGIKTDRDFRKRILDREIQTIEIDDEYIKEFGRIYDSRENFGAFILLSGEEKYKAEEIFSYIDLIEEVRGIEE